MLTSRRVSVAGAVGGGISVVVVALDESSHFEAHREASYEFSGRPNEPPSRPADRRTSERNSKV